MEEKSICPFCLSEDLKVLATDLYECKNCGMWFDSDDVEHEALRQKISALCSEVMATEENPIKCEVIIGDDEAQGLSDSEKPLVTGVFHDYDAIVWVTVYGAEGPWELDGLSTSDLRNILEGIEHKK